MHISITGFASSKLSYGISHCPQLRSLPKERYLGIYRSKYMKLGNREREYSGCFVMSCDSW